MRKILLPLMILFSFIGCEKENSSAILTKESLNVSANSKLNRVEICHLGENGTFHPISINANALEAHLAHGDMVGNCSIITISICSQVWMVGNLDVSTFRNGELITQAQSKEEWLVASTAGVPAWCYYNYDPSTYQEYGKLYNWYAVSDPRGIAPNGYHVPTDDEWTVLTNCLGGEEVAGMKMKSTSGWIHNGNGTNSSGFDGKPTGFCDYYGNCNDFGNGGYWWSSTESNTFYTYYSWLRILSSSNGNVMRASNPKAFGFSVRCLKD